MSEPAVPRQSIPPWTIGWRLKRSLNFADISAQEMADELGVHVGTVSRWMNDHEVPKRVYLRVWALRTGVPLEWLTGEEVSPSDRERRSSRLDKSDILAFRKSLGRRFVVDAEVAR